MGTSSPPPSRTLPLLGLAPNGGYLAANITACAGGLLHHLFTLTRNRAVVFCGPIHEFPRPGVTRHCAQWSADFPQTAMSCLRLPGQPTCTRIIPFHRTPVNRGGFSKTSHEVAINRATFSNRDSGQRRPLPLCC